MGAAAGVGVREKRFEYLLFNPLDRPTLMQRKTNEDSLMFMVRLDSWRINSVCFALVMMLCVVSGVGLLGGGTWQVMKKWQARVQSFDLDRSSRSELRRLSSDLYRSSTDRYT